MPGGKCDCTCACPHTCKIPCTSENSPIPTSLLTVQSHMPNRNDVVATATQVTVTFCFQKYVLSCFILNKIFDMLLQQETLLCRYTNLGSHVQIQISRSNLSIYLSRCHLKEVGCHGSPPISVKRQFATFIDRSFCHLSNIHRPCCSSASSSSPARNTTFQYRLL